MAAQCPKCGTKGFESGGPRCKSCGWKDPVLEPWVPSGWYWDPANPRQARRWDQVLGAWVGKPRKDAFVSPRAIPSTTPQSEIEAQDPKLRPIARVGTCRVLGGHGLSVPANTTVQVLFTLDAMRLVQRGKDDVFVPYADIRALEIGGPGARRSGGGFIGGGFGLQGAAEGALIASALNMLTTTTKIDTVICVQTSTAELFLHNGETTPDRLRMRLSQVFNILRGRTNAPQAESGAEPGLAGDHVVDRLAKLAEMLDRNLITSEEFATLKRELLGEP